MIIKRAILNWIQRNIEPEIESATIGEMGAFFFLPMDKY